MCRPIAVAAMIIVAVLVGFYGVPGASTMPSRDVAALVPLDLAVPADIPTAAPADAP